MGVVARANTPISNRRNQTFPVCHPNLPGFDQTFFGPSLGKSRKPAIGVRKTFSIGLSQQVGVSCICAMDLV